MRLKEIKPGMAIHCKNDEEKKALLEEAERLGYVWYYIKSKPTKLQIELVNQTIHFYDANKQNGFTADYKHITQSEHTGKDVIEFSDLILPELTAEEVLSTISEICENSLCGECYLGNYCNKQSSACSLRSMEPSVVIDACIKWKADHEKNEPEIEWVYRVFGAENYGEKFFQTEEEAIKRCEELAKSQKTKQYARYERVCRVKAVE